MQKCRESEVWEDGQEKSSSYHNVEQSSSSREVQQKAVNVEPQVRGCPEKLSASCESVAETWLLWLIKGLVFVLDFGPLYNAICTLISGPPVIILLLNIRWLKRQRWWRGRCFCGGWVDGLFAKDELESFKEPNCNNPAFIFAGCWYERRWCSVVMGRKFGIDNSWELNYAPYEREGGNVWIGCVGKSRCEHWFSCFIRMT